jgi:hypothetical protein
LEFKRSVRGFIGKTELNADVERELHFRRTGDFLVVLIFLAPLLALRQPK